jgi:ketosteroid isomerase-like protein
MLPAIAMALVLATQVQEAAPPPSPPEAVVRGVLQEVRKGELFLDAQQLTPFVAASFTMIEGGARISGSFAFLEPIRRMRERGAVVKELEFEQTLVHVYGASAIATYRYRKVWTDGGATHHEQGWSTDVFEKRDDGAWLLIHRQRGK